MSVDQFEEAKKANQKWKYSNERTSESWRKVEATAIGSSLQKIKSRVEKGAVLIVCVLSAAWFASSYQIRRSFVQHISWRVSLESVINKRKSSCYFAWRNDSIAWMFVHPTNTAVILNLKGFLLSIKNYFYQHQNISIILSGEKVKHARFLKSP